MTDMLVSKRHSKRTRIFVPGHLASDSITQKVRVHDISVDGALLDAAQPLAVFEPITLRCGQSRINGIVAWSEDGLIGIEFSEPVSGKTLNDAFGSKLKVSAPKSYRVPKN